ncbi:MAG: ABC transporter permease, partial [Chloroflexota bacterium]|nr:ABC transporter permease [Chloroflexota bacterium]
MAKAVSGNLFSQRVSSVPLASWVRRTVFYAALLIVWEAMARSGIWPDYLFPGPLAVLNTLLAGFSSGLYFQAALVSLERLAIGYAISLVLGLTLGLLIARIRFLEETLGSLVLG